MDDEKKGLKIIGKIDLSLFENKKRQQKILTRKPTPEQLIQPLPSGLDALKIFNAIDFGDIDGLQDRNLGEYFVDKDYWTQIIEKETYFVIGRKGTGKSAIYNWIKMQEAERGVIVSNLSFKNFPFEKLFRLSDDNFCAPNQYNSIWSNVIWSEIAKLICIDAKFVGDEDYREIKNYVDLKFGTDLSDLHKMVITRTEKQGLRLTLSSLTYKGEESESAQYGDGFDNISQINQRLQKVIINYLKRAGTSQYIIQFDQLDDNYTSFLKNPDIYFQCIICLFKTIYEINQSLHRQEIPVKVIGYLRSDIFYMFNEYDAESSRWDDHLLYLNWVINRIDKWPNSELISLLDKRIAHSISEMRDWATPFASLTHNLKMKDMHGTERSLFRYMIFRSFQRPRDIIQFCKKIQRECAISGKLDERTVQDAERKYSEWLINELTNEIGPRIEDKKALFQFLRIISNGEWVYEDVCAKYETYAPKINIDIEDLSLMLYQLGILQNISINKWNKNQYHSIIINEHSSFSNGMLLQVHPGLREGLKSY